VDESMEEIQYYIYGIVFSTDKEEVAAAAEDRGAPGNIVQRLLVGCSGIRPSCWLALALTKPRKLTCAHRFDPPTAPKSRPQAVLSSP
jgi:hypothetical protein